MNMMVNTSELVANEAETKKIAGTELKRAVSKLVASWERKQTSKATKLGGLGLMAISLAACNSSSDDTATPATPAEETPATPAAPVVNNIALANATTNVFGTANNDNITGTATTAAAAAATTTNTITADHIIADSSTTDADVLTVTTSTDFTATPTVVGIETINFTLESVTAGNAIYDVSVDNMAANTYNIDVNKTGSPVAQSIVSGVKSNATVAFTTDFATAVTVNGKTDNEALTVTSSADTTTVNSAGTLTAATVTVSGTTNTAAGRTIASDSDAAFTATTTAADMTIQAAAATTIIATSSGDIDANTTDLTAATSVTLTSGDEMTVGLAAAATATLSAKGTGTGGTTASIVEDGATGTLTSVSLSGNGGAAQFNLTAAEGITSVTLTGSQNVGATMDASEIDALTGNKVTVVDNTADAASANITTNLTVGTAAGDMDLTAAAVDNINVAISNASKTLTVASGATVTYSVDNTSTTIDGVDASAATNSVTINLDDGDKTTANAGVDLATAFTITDFKTATINANLDANNFNAAVYDDSAIAALTASADNTNVTINAGANGITLSGTTTTGTGALSINSDGAVGLGTSAITASAFTHTGSGAVTHTDLNSNTLATYTTGGGNDNISVVGTNGDLTLSTGAGNDNIIWEVTTTTAKSYTINGGDGADKFIIDGAAAGGDLDLSTGTSTITLSGIETIMFNTDDTNNALPVTLKAGMLNGAGLILDQEDTNDTLTLTLALGTITNLDLSSVTVNTDNLTAADIISVTQGTAAAATTMLGTNGMKMTFAGNSGADNLTGADQADSLTGNGGNDIISGLGGADIIAGNAGADIITGGAGNDIITGGAGADTITGGAGNDTYKYDTGDAASGESIVEASAGGTDVVSIVTTTDFSAMAASSFDEIETITIASAQTATFSAAQLTGETIALDSAGTDFAVINMSFGGTANLSGIAGTFAAADTVTINGTGGAETLIATGEKDTISLGAGGDTITAGLGDDVITLGAGVDTVKFSNANNGNDTITVLAPAADKLDFAAVLSSGTIANATSGTTITLASTGALAVSGASIAVANNQIYLANVAAVTKIDSAASVKGSLVNTGVMDAVDIAASAEAVLVLSANNDADAIFVYNVVNDATTAVATAEITLIATITTTSNAASLNTITTANVVL